MKQVCTVCIYSFCIVGQCREIDLGIVKLMTKRAPYATHHEESKGRLYPEPEKTGRTAFQRDRDRIIHSDAFRKLQYKTQVYTSESPSDHYRTRLTHSMEVAQVARSICRSLKIDEDLGECVALAHDLGHTPFGHAGEDVLDRCMRDYGGYRHNDQTLKIVTQLERRYPAFDGLNLTWEAREGIAKHNGPLKSGYDEDLYEGLEPETFSGLEAQVAALSDDIAYGHHDIDDSLHMGSLTLPKIRELDGFNRVFVEVESSFPQADEKRLIKETLRRMMDKAITDLVKTSLKKIKDSGVKHADEVRAYGQPLIGFSDAMMKSTKEMKVFMFENVYRHYQVNRATFRAYRVIEDLFETYMNHRRMLPVYEQQFLPKDKSDNHTKAHVVANYIAGLTDRSALQEHARLFGIR